jgi:NADPH:quinone reductase-like Zn-dependent oxidoreductase
MLATARVVHWTLVSVAACVGAQFFVVEVPSRHLERIAALIETGELTTSVGEVLPLAAARIAHEMRAGKPHKRGKIVLTVEGSK